MKYILLFFISFVFGLITTRFCIYIGHRIGHYANIDRKVVLSGGIGLGLVIALLGFGFSLFSHRILVIFISSIFIMLIGLIDDLWDLRVFQKLLFQGVLGLVLISFGIYFKNIPYVISLPLSLLWILGLTNAFNFLDNMDGLCPGMVGITSMFLGIVAFLSNFQELGALCLILSGVSFGFLVFNFKPAKIFLGDAGSLFLGFFLSSLSILLFSEGYRFNSVLSLSILALIFLVPIFNMIFIIITRKLLKIPITKGKGDHINYCLLGYGLGEYRSVILTWGFSVLSGSLAIIYLYLEEFNTFIFSLLSIVVWFYLGIFLYHSQVLKYLSKGSQGSNHKNSLYRLHILYRVSLIICDIILICVGYWGAYIIRFEEEISTVQLRNFVQTLPFFIGVRILLFYKFGLYSTYWRYYSIYDFKEFIKALLLGSLFLTSGILMFRVSSFSRSVLFLEMILGGGLICGMRLFLRLFYEYSLNIKMQRRSQRALIINASDIGRLALLDIRNSPKEDVEIVGFLDNDIMKQYFKIEGVPVLGVVDELPRIAQKNKVDNVIIATDSETEKKQLIDICNKHSLKPRLFSRT